MLINNVAEENDSPVAEHIVGAGSWWDLLLLNVDPVYNEH